MTVIKLRGSWTKDQLPHIGITDALAEFMRTHRLTRMPFNGLLEFDEHRDPTDGAQQAIFRIVALEPAMADDGTDPDRRGEQTLQMIDQARQTRSLGPVEQTLFDHQPGPGRGDDFDDDPDDDQDDEGEVDGQMRLGPDGPHQVPEASGEELLAEAREEPERRERGDQA